MRDSDGLLWTAWCGRAFRLGAAGMLLLALCLFLTACSGQESSVEPDTLKIALIAPFSGDFEPLGRSVYNGAVLAVEEWNQRGGFLGQPVQVVLFDSQCDYKTGVQVAKDAIEDQGLQLIIGAVCAKATEGVAQIADREEVLQISPAAVNPDLTLDIEEELRPLVFRVPFVDPEQGKAAAQFALKTLDAETAALIYDESSFYGAALASAFAEAFSAGQGEIVAEELYDREEVSYFDLLEDVREAEPDVLYVPGYYDVVVKLVSQARAFGLLQPVIGSDGWDSPELDLRAVGNSYFTAHYFSGEPRDAVRLWEQRYIARYIVPPDVLATLSYDAVNILARAIKQSSSTDPENVAETMESMAFEMISGPLVYDNLHNPIKSVLLLQVQGDEVVYVDRILP